MTRTVCRVVTLAAVVTAAMGSPASASEITWRASMWGPARASTQPLEWMAKEVAARTNGQLKIEVTHGKGKPADSAELLKSNGAEIAYFCAQYFTEQMPLVTVMDLPMLAPDNVNTLGRAELALADHPAIQAELRKWNTKMLLPTPLPQYQLMGNRKVTKIDDLQGAKVRIAPEMGKVLDEYGATTVVIPSTESAAALKSGALDLVALPYPYAFFTFKIHEVSKYATEKISLGAPLCYTGVNLKAWEALPLKIQETLLSARLAAIGQYEAIYAKDDAAQIASFKDKGIETSTFSSADRSRLVAKAIKIWHAWVEEREKQGLKGREVFEFVQGKIREFTRK